jgi:hypothetical protein
VKAFAGAWLFGIAIGLAFILAAAVADVACYQTSTKPVSCSADPYQDGCLPPIHDRRADAGH